MVNKREIKRAVETADENIQANVFVGKKRDKLPPSLLVMQSPCIFSAEFLSPAACRILLMFFGIADWGNTVSLTVNSIGQKLKVSKPTVIKGLNELESNGIIIKTKYEIDKRGNEYILNPYLAWKGDSVKRTEKKKETDTRQLSMFGATAQEQEEREIKEIKTTKRTIDVTYTEE